MELIDQASILIGQIPEVCVEFGKGYRVMDDSFLLLIYQTIMLFEFFLFHYGIFHD